MRENKDNKGTAKMFKVLYTIYMLDDWYIIQSDLTSFFCSQHHGYVSQQPSDDLNLSIVGEL